ncbi:MAG: DUF3256 family protein [Muribaculaceae bacterium]|nr:DUF3256 family protein [Muribaculaceae bacterium]
MNSFRYILLTLLLLPLAVSGQLTAEQALVNAPSTLFPGITRLTRMDMLDYFKSGSERTSATRLSGTARVLELTPENVVVETAANRMVTTQVALALNSKKDTIIVCVSNIATPAMDGALKLYDSSWQPLKETYFAAPALKDWIKKGVPKSDAREVMSLVPFAMAEYTYDPTSATLRLTPTFADYLPEDVWNKVKDSLSSALVYKWNGRKFVPQRAN